MTVHPGDPRCSALSVSTGEPVAGTAPVAGVWIVVEHPDGWGDAPLARAGHGVRVVMARGPRPSAPPEGDRPGRSRVWVGYVGPTARLRLGLVDDPAEVAGWDLAAVAAGSHRAWGEPQPGPLLVVCANGRRDRCCGHAGRRLAERLWATTSSCVLTSTHLGGHRFAPTALLLPWGIAFGRLDADSARTVLDLAHHGRTATHLMRGHSALDPPAQVAELHARAAVGYDGLAPLRVDVQPGPADRARALVEAQDQGRHLEVALRRTRVDVVASCGHAPEPVERWTVEAIRPCPPGP